MKSLERIGNKCLLYHMEVLQQDCGSTDWLTINQSVWFIIPVSFKRQVHLHAHTVSQKDAADAD